METTYKNYLILGLLALFILFGVGIYYSSRPLPTLGNIGETPYYSTTTSANWNQSVKYKVLKTGPGHLGSVIITGATLAAGLNFYDGTTTASHTMHATTTIGEIKVSTPAGSYPFNTSFSYGLIVEFPTAIGAASSTITWQ